MTVPDRDPDGLLGLLRDLHDTNLEQWGLEDRSRERNGDDTAVAEAKRGIDNLNARRHGVVEAIDATITDAVTQQPSATPATESPGMAFDRLSVLIICFFWTVPDARPARHLGARSEEQSRHPVGGQHSSTHSKPTSGRCRITRRSSRATAWATRSSTA